MVRGIASTCAVLVLGTLGCPGRNLPEGEGGGTSSGSSSGAATEAGSTTSTTTDASSVGSTSPASSSDGSGADGSTTTAEPGTCEDAMADYSATAEVIDQGLGPEGATVTIVNCLDELAYVYQDCCYGAAFQLERKNASADPWYPSQPSFVCDCMGPIEPLMIEPLGEIVIETNPAEFDSEPICQEPYFAIYRWIFLVGPEPACAECWQSVPTNEMDWYCEG
jgi:hypothetical protein